MSSSTNSARACGSTSCRASSSRTATSQGLIDQGVRGVTSNPTIFQSAIADGDAYDEQLREVLKDETQPKEVFLSGGRRDTRGACDLLQARSYDEGDEQGTAGYRSRSTRTSPTTRRARSRRPSACTRLVDRKNLLVKTPRTKEGLPAIEESIAGGIPINVTLIFSLDRHREVAEAYVRGLERLVEGGGDPGTVASVASFFVSRVDTEADKRLDELGGHDELKGKLAIANAKLAYQTYKEIFSGDRWEALAGQGASVQRPLWASTSTKTDAYKDTIYVEELVGPETVNTMPRELVEAVLDHGEIRGNTIEEDLDGARKVFDDLKAAGIDYDDVSETLEREGVEKFAKSFKELFSDVESKRDELVAA